MLYIELFVMKLSNHLLRWLPWIPNLVQFFVQSVMLDIFLYLQLQLHKILAMAMKRMAY